MTHINDVDVPNMPPGGEKDSAIGRFGTHDVLDFTTQHWISVQHAPSAYPF